MVEGSPLKKSDEQYPLLMVNGGGDVLQAQTQPQSVLSSVWSVNTGRPKWRERWPELLSACWMMVILLGISFLVFYVIGIIAYRTQPFVVVKCNNSIGDQDVYFYEIVKHGNSIDFLSFSDFLARLAESFPNLRFKVFFLNDDTLQVALKRHAEIFSKLIQSRNFVFGQDNTQELYKFQNQYPNFNITVMPLSVFMAMTPLRNWLNIHNSALPFYARIFSVWQNGGVAIDLKTYSNQYKKNGEIDRYIKSVLTQHNDRSTLEGYTKLLKEISLNNNEDDFVSLILDVFEQITSNTRNFINKSFPKYEAVREKNKTFIEPLLVRTHRSKRELSMQAPMPSVGNGLHSLARYTANGEKTVPIVENVMTTDTNKTENRTTPIHIVNATTIGPSKIMNKSISIHANTSEVPQAVFVYDLVFSSGNADSSLFSDPISHSFMDTGLFTATNKKKKSAPPIFLALHSEGLFVAATEKSHPLLEHIIISNHAKRAPSIIIKEVIMEKCATFYERYCDNIFVV